MRGYKARGVHWEWMDSRQIAAWLLVAVTLAAVIAALLYATREGRAERRASRRGERRRVQKNQARINAEHEKRT